MDVALGRSEARQCKRIVFHEGLARMSRDENSATRVLVSVHSELQNHTRPFERKIYQVADTVYVAIGWGIANIIMVEGPDGVVIIDTG